jgi:hypothetical protein
MSEFRENDIEKISAQPIVHDPTFISPTTDDDAAQGIVLTVYCPTPPTDGDVAVYVAANNRFEFQAPAAISSPVTVSDGMGGFELVFDTDGNVVYA